MGGKVAGRGGRAADQRCLGTDGTRPECDQNQAKTQEPSYRLCMGGVSPEHFFNYRIGAGGTVWSRAFCRVTLPSIPGAIALTSQLRKKLATAIQIFTSG